eukprot:SAG11_NODE_5528_length_1534_cov_2.023693_2_plen_150_part_00
MMFLSEVQPNSPAGAFERECPGLRRFSSNSLETPFTASRMRPDQRCFPAVAAMSGCTRMHGSEGAELRELMELMELREGDEILINTHARVSDFTCDCSASSRSTVAHCALSSVILIRWSLSLSLICFTRCLQSLSSISCRPLSGIRCLL